LAQVTSSLVIAVFVFLPFAESMSAANLKHAGTYLNTLGGDIEVITVASPQARYQPRRFRSPSGPFHRQNHSIRSPV
jgi:hypothetical protein